MDDFTQLVKSKYPKLKFKPTDSYYWSPETEEICYKSSTKDNNLSKWSLLHEVGHALLKHKSYKADYMLIRLELDAWEKAVEISGKFNVIIDDNHIQDCLDTYRDWIYKRSICPSCTTKSFQQSDLNHYRCFNCHATWRVTPSRFCRAYRVTEKADNTQKVFI